MLSCVSICAVVLPQCEHVHKVCVDVKHKGENCGNMMICMCVCVCVLVLEGIINCVLNS